MLTSVQRNRYYTSGSKSGDSTVQNNKRAPVVCCILWHFFSLQVHCTVQSYCTGGPGLMKKGCGPCDSGLLKGILHLITNAEGDLAFNNKCVNLLSNACGIMPFATVKWWRRVTPKSDGDATFVQREWLDTEVINAMFLLFCMSFFTFLNIIRCNCQLIMCCCTVYRWEN